MIPKWVSLSLLICLAFLPSARAVTSADADTAFTAYNKAFYFTRGTNGYYHATNGGGKTFFWDRAEQLEMILDVYERSSNAVCLTMFSNILNGFITDHKALWTKNDFNDDIMWMVIACSRGYQHTKSPLMLDLARKNFDMCYARSWSTNLGGGLWWKINNRSKNACVNGPGSIAAHLLYDITGERGYLEKAEAIFQWERATLFDTNTGAIADNIRINGRIGEAAMTYNQGTFIGAANLLGHTNEARLAADFTMNHLSRDGIMPQYGEDGDGGGFNGICARWVSKFMKQRGLESRYQAWLQKNADQAWKIRRTSDNLSWTRWREQTPDDELHSWGCSSTIVIMNVALPSEVSSTR